MKTISQVKYGNLEINLLKEEKFIGYSFGYEGRNYGQKTELKTTKSQEIMEVTAVLIINAIESYTNLCQK